MDSEKTIPLSFRLSEKDFNVLRQQATAQNMDEREFVRYVLSETIPGFSGIVQQHGGAREGAGRPRRQRQAS